MKAERGGAPTIGERIRAERARRGLTQRALADAANFSDRYISNIECGKRQPTLANLQAIAGAMGMDVQELMADIPSTPIALDSDLAKLASILRDASSDDRARLIDIARSLVKTGKGRR